MRLIDANKLSRKSCPMGKRKYCCNCGEKRTIKNPYTNQSISCDDIRFDFLQMIDREKTVKAISIEWVKKYLHELETISKDNLDLGEDGYFGDIVAIENMLSAWEKENEQV